MVTSSTRIAASFAISCLSLTALMPLASQRVSATETLDSTEAETTPAQPSGEPEAPEASLDPQESRQGQFVPMQPEGDSEGEFSLETDYVLGGGDVIQVDFSNVVQLNDDTTDYTILMDGTVNLPWVGKVAVQGLNLEEAGEAIEQAYFDYLRNPTITVTLLQARPMRVSIIGEVNRPGTYTTGQEVNIGPAGVTEGQLQVGELRTVTEAIQTAGGITQQADIRSIEVRRPQYDGSSVSTEINLWALLQEGNTGQDIVLRDGDTVIIPEATNLDLEEAQALSAANFSPDTVNVNVVGQVMSPGLVTMTPNASLNQAILAAGGFDSPRARSGSVKLVRLNPNGTVTERIIPVDYSDALNEDTNPVIRNNDVVVVSRSNLARSTDFLSIVETAASAIINPIRGIFSIIDSLD